MKKLLLLLLLFSCNHKKPNKKQTVHLTRTEADYKFIPNTLSVNELIATLERSVCVYGKYVGFAGKKSPVYENYEILLSTLNDSTWYSLCNSKAVTMRYYAYHALHNKKSPLAEKAWHLLENDNTVVCWKSADLEMTCSLNYLLKPIAK